MSLIFSNFIFTAISVCSLFLHIAVILLNYFILVIFAWQRVELCYFDWKHFLLVSCFWYCLFAKCTVIMPQQNSLRREICKYIICTLSSKVLKFTVNYNRNHHKTRVLKYDWWSICKITPSNNKKLVAIVSAYLGLSAPLDEGSCFIFSTCNNCCKFLASDGITLQNDHQLQ